MAEEEGPNICKRLRDATKTVHDSSDKLVNLKLGVALSDPNVWYQGLLVFSKIFFKLESCLDQCPSLEELDLGGLRRTKAFEQDLDYFYGTKWRKENDNEAVQKYIDHLDQLANEEPLLLIAYIYHLYMGLLSGGQILSKKKYLFGSKDDNDPNAVTTFDDSPSALKKKLRTATITITQDLDKDLQQQIVEEGVNVFKFNNSIIHTVEGVDEIFYKKIFKWIGILVFMLMIIFAYFMI